MFGSEEYGREMFQFTRWIQFHRRSLKIQHKNVCVKRWYELFSINHQPRIPQLIHSRLDLKFSANVRLTVSWRWCFALQTN